MVFLIKTLQLLLSLSILVIVHECGHFLFARLFHIRAERFYLFFNPSFSIFRMKKINGRWQFKWFSKNDKNTRTRYNYKGEEISEIIPTAELPDNNWKKYPASTEYGIGWIPLGGYVSISGMIDESMNTAQMKQPAKPWEFRSKKAWQRLLVMIAGVCVNFVLALIIYSAILFTWGKTDVEIQSIPMSFSETALAAGYEEGDKIIAYDGHDAGIYSEKTLLRLLEAKEVTVIRNGDTVLLHMPEKGLIRDLLKKEDGFFLGIYTQPIIDSILPNSKAIGLLQKGDRFIAINDTVPINSFAGLSIQLKKNKKDSLKATVLRNSDTLHFTIPLSKEGLIGFAPLAPAVDIKTRTTHYNFWQSIPAGFSYGIGKLSSYIHQMKFLFTKEGMNSISGIGGMGSMFAPTWDWQSFWTNTAFLSLALAFLNILPIPALDGGHVLFLLYEVIARRKPDDKFIIAAQVLGMLLLFSLFIYATGMDIFRFLIK